MLIEVKNTTSNDSFLHECLTSTEVDSLISDLVKIYNFRLFLKECIDEGRQLQQFGIQRRPEWVGLDRQDGEPEAEKEDPTGKRIGVPPPKSQAEKLQKYLDEAESMLSKDLVQQRKPITIEQLSEGFSNLKGCVMMLYPMGLPEYDRLQQLLNDPDAWTSKDCQDGKTSTLWFAGKQFHRGQKLSDTKSIGKNEKVKIIAKLQKQGSGAPASEPVVDPELQKKLMAYWHKKQKESQELLESDEVEYLNSEWANPKALQQSFHGIRGNVTWNSLNEFLEKVKTFA